MKLLLIGVTLLSFTINQIAIRIFQVKYEHRGLSLYFFQFVFSMLASMLCFHTAGNLSGPQNTTLLYGFLFGICYFLTVLLLSVCFSRGEMVIGSVIVNLSFIVPIVYSLAVLNERITLTQIIGTILMGIAIYFSAADKRGEKGKCSQSVLLFALGAFLCNGLSAVFQKHYRLTSSIDESMLFLSTGYLTAAMFFGFLFVFKRRSLLAPAPVIKEKAEENEEVSAYLKNIGVYLLAIVAAFSTFLGNGLIMRLSVAVPASILYPIINGGMTIFIALCSAFCFGEKLTKNKLLLLFFGILAIVVVNL